MIIEAIPILYMACSIVSWAVRGMVLTVRLVGQWVDPLPPDVGPQIAQPLASAAIVEPYVSSLPADAVEASAVRVARGGVDLGSGVCVDGRGYVLTARHVIAQGECEVHFPGRSAVRGHVLGAAPGGLDGVTLLLCDGSDFSSVPLAESVPVRGAALTVVGYHSGNLVRLAGHSRGDSPNLLHVDSARSRLLTCSVESLPGMSGGPIVNAQGELVSLVSCRQRGVMFGLSLAALRQAAQSIPAEAGSSTLLDSRAPRAVLEYWWSENCPACRRFSADFGPGSAHQEELARRYDIRFFNADRYAAAAKERGIDALPAFYLPDEQRLVAGYTTPDDLLERLAPSAAQPPSPFMPHTPASVPHPMASTETSASVPAPVPTGSRAEDRRDDPPAEPVGLIAHLRSMLLHALSMALSGVIAAFISWRAQQSFIKRRLIDRAVSKALRKADVKAHTHPIAGRVWDAGHEYLKRERG